MTRQLRIWVGIVLASTAAMPVLAQLSLGPTHLIVGDPVDLIWRYKADPNNEKSVDKSISGGSATTPVVIDDLKPGDVVRITVGELLHGFSPNKPDLVVRCGDDPNTMKGAVLQELDCQPGQASKVDIRFRNGTLRLQVLQTFRDPMDFLCTAHGDTMSGVLKLQSSPNR